VGGSGWVVILVSLESSGYGLHTGGNFSRFGGVLREIWTFVWRMLFL
jgi:hypothetical protein